MIVKPAEGRIILDPVTMRPLTPAGIPAADGDLHWARMREDGDVTLEPDPDPLSAVVTPPSAAALPSQEPSE